MSEPLLIAIFGFFSAVLGAGFHALFQRWQSKDDHLRRQKIESYASYFNGVAQLSHARTKEELARGNATIAEARGRIALYGSPEVIEAMTAAFRCGPINDKDSKVHAAMVRAMRSDANLANGHPSEQTLFEMLYGTEEKRI
jgi:hypothetical protein